MIFLAQKENYFSELEAVARRVFAQYQFSEVRLPLFESIDLFSRSLGETSDVVEKEMFTFSDRGDRNFALRPEGTAGMVRHFIEQKLAVKSGLHRLFYMGPMFRAERPQAGRYRQFYQIGSEYFGDASPAADADTVIMIGRILAEFGINGFRIQVNSLGDRSSRSAYRKELLAYLETKKNLLSEESQRRMTTNPLRVLDSKIDGPKLKDAPLLQDFLTDSSKKHFETFLNLVQSESFPVELNATMVRGLDYYTDTVFEVVSDDLGAQNALAAGGRYDDLVHDLGGPSVPGVGFALGVDRVVSVREKQSKTDLKTDAKKDLVVVAPLVEEALSPAFALSNQLRSKGFSVPPVILKRKVKNILSMAVDFGATWVILLGSEELAEKVATVKNLADRTQTKQPLDQVVNHIQ